ncbi:EpsG family protein [Citrobacter freundii]|uniref:EpsG family protein n=1 Tax=Citrobacter freundii TaxID=546 RepID=UPI001780068E|nr:EpsG family protein [Citrobacter freundii]MBD9990825.1 EpsG family protein [Citrobacter freundii]MBE0055586.1 EpsG family protein [Citrobacter freundii]
MNYFLLFLLFSFLLLSLLTGKIKALNSYITVCLSVFLIFIAGLRINDSDYVAYNNIFLETPELFDFTLSSIKNIHGELGYLFISSLVKTLGGGFLLFIFIVSFISVGLTTVSFQRLSIIPLLSLLLYFSHVYLLREMIQIRAGLAVAIVLYGFSVSSKISVHLFSVLLASFFHSGAFIIIPFYFCARWAMINFKWFIVLFLGATFFSEMGGLEKLLTVMLNFGVLPTGVANYIGWDLYDYKLPLLFNPVMWKCLLIIYLTKDIFNLKVGCRNNTLGIIRELYVYGLLVMVAFSHIAILSGRLSTFLSFGENILIVYGLFYNFKPAIAYIIVFFICIAQMSYDLLYLDVHPTLSMLFL